MSTKSDVIKQNVIRLNGINRSQSDNLSSDGDMEEIIGLRKKNGSFEVIGDYPVKLKYNDGVPIDASEYEKIFIHKTSEYKHYILYGKLVGYTKKCLFGLIGENRLLIFELDELLLLQPIDNILTVFYKNGEAEKKTYLVWNEQNMTYQEIDIEGIKLNVELNLNANAVPHSESDNISLNFSRGGDVSDRKKNLYGGLYDAFTSIINKISEKNRVTGNPSGYFTWRFALRLFNGSYIKMSPVFLENLALPSPQYLYNSDSMSGDQSQYLFWEFSILHRGFANIHTHTHTNSSGTWSDDFVLSCSMYKKTLNFTMSIDNYLSDDTIDNLKKYIIGVDIFMSVETSPLRYDKDFLIDEFIRDTEGSSIYYTSRTRGEQLYSRIFKNEKQLIDDIKTKSGAMYKVLSFDFLDFNGSNITKTLEKDLTDITANEQLIYEDQLYSEEIPSGILLYNSKLHEYGMKSTVKTDFNINDLLHKTKFSYQDTLSATDIKDRLMPPLLASFNTSYMAKDYDRALFYILFSDGNRAIHIDESNSNSIRTISGGYLPKITPLLFLNPLITKVKVYILVDDHSIKFTPEYSNEDGISFAKIKPLDIDSRSDINILAYSEEVVKKNRPNILKVSEENNPFIISNSKTYKVGGGEIFKLHVNTKAVSSGQFGEYPLIALCSDGRWALGLGSGEVDYSSIKPLSRDVYKKGENNDPMAQLDDAVVFATERGLLISSGEEVQELSQLIEGDLFRFTEPGFDHMDLARQAITNSLLVQLLPAVSKIPFKEYLNGSNIGYIYGENREIVIANPNYDYCYIYSLSSGIWYKNNIRIKYFLSDYPCLYAVSDNKLIDLTAEQPTAGRDTFFLTKPVKLDGLSFKEAHRAVLRSYIKPSGTTYCGFYVFGSEDGQLWRFLGGTEFDGKIALTGETADFRDIGCNVERIDVKYIRIAFAGKIKSGSKLDFMELLARSLSWK